MKYKVLNKRTGEYVLDDSLFLISPCGAIFEMDVKARILKTIDTDEYEAVPVLKRETIINLYSNMKGVEDKRNTIKWK